MNRYQFEDLISEYIENELSLSKRKEFETYLEENPDARSLVDSVRYTMDTMRSLPKVKANPKFNERLMTRIKSNIDWSATPMPSKGTIFGFTPIHASLLTGLMIAFVFVSMQLFYPEPGTQIKERHLFADEQVPSLSNPDLNTLNRTTPDLADFEDDSLDIDPKKQQKNDFSKKMHFVND
jgi:hypothetical protein